MHRYAFKLYLCPINITTIPAADTKSVINSIAFVVNALG